MTKSHPLGAARGCIQGKMVFSSSVPRQNRLDYTRVNLLPPPKTTLLRNRLIQIPESAPPPTL